MRLLSTGGGGGGQAGKKRCTNTPQRWIIKSLTKDNLYTSTLCSQPSVQILCSICRYLGMYVCVYDDSLTDVASFLNCWFFLVLPPPQFPPPLATVTPLLRL